MQQTRSLHLVIHYLLAAICQLFQYTYVMLAVRREMYALDLQD